MIATFSTSSYGHFGYKQKNLRKDTGSLDLPVPPYVNCFETAEYNSRLFFAGNHVTSRTLWKERMGRSRFAEFCT
jgi:hypothetical protein